MTTRLRALALVPPSTAMLGMMFLVLASPAVADEPSANPTTIAFPAGGTIRMSLHTGTMEVVGVEQQQITVSWRSSRVTEPDVKVKLTRSGTNAATLVVDGP